MNTVRVLMVLGVSFVCGCYHTREISREQAAAEACGRDATEIVLIRLHGASDSIDIGPLRATSLTIGPDSVRWIDADLGTPVVCGVDDLVSVSYKSHVAAHAALGALLGAAPGLVALIGANSRNASGPHGAMNVDLTPSFAPVFILAGAVAGGLIGSHQGGATDIIVPPLLGTTATTSAGRIPKK